MKVGAVGGEQGALVGVVVVKPAFGGLLLPPLFILQSGLGPIPKSDDAPDDLEHLVAIPQKGLKPAALLFQRLLLFRRHQLAALPNSEGAAAVPAPGPHPLFPLQESASHPENDPVLNRPLHRRAVPNHYPLLSRLEHLLPRAFLEANSLTMPSGKIRQRNNGQRPANKTNLKRLTAMRDYA